MTHSSYASNADRRIWRRLTKNINPQYRTLLSVSLRRETILSVVYVEKLYRNERENDAYSTLQKMGVTLLRSGNKPGTRDKAYRLLISNRLTIDEVEQFIARNSEVRSVRPQRRQRGN